jgi:hypothetical protein
MSEQMQTQVNAQSSNPAVARSKAFKFLESIALNNSVKENIVYRKILSLRTEQQSFSSVNFFKN